MEKKEKLKNTFSHKFHTKPCDKTNAKSFEVILYNFSRTMRSAQYEIEGKKKSWSLRGTKTKTTSKQKRHFNVQTGKLVLMFAVQDLDFLTFT